MKSQSDALSKRKGRYLLRKVGENAELTLYAPRDGAGRVTSASDLTLELTPSQFNTFAADVAYLKAGMGK